LKSASSSDTSNKTLALTAEVLKQVIDTAGFSVRLGSASVIACTIILTDEDITASLEISKNAKPHDVALRYARETWLTEETINDKASQTTHYLADSNLPDLRHVVANIFGDNLGHNVRPFKVSIDLKQASLTAFTSGTWASSNAEPEVESVKPSVISESQSSAHVEERTQIMPAETIVSEEAVSTGRTDGAKYATYSRSEVDRLLKAQAEAITATLGGKIAAQSRMFQEAITEQQKVFAKSIDKVVQHADEFRTRLETSASSQRNSTSDQLNKFNSELTKELEQFKTSITKSITSSTANIKTIDEKLKSLQPDDKNSAVPGTTLNSSNNNNIVLLLLVANIIATLATAAAVFMHH